LTALTVAVNLITSSPGENPPRRPLGEVGEHVARAQQPEGGMTVLPDIGLGMAANGNVSVLVARCFLLYRSRLATVPHLLAPLAGQTGSGWRRADGRAGPALQRERPVDVAGVFLERHQDPAGRLGSVGYARLSSRTGMVRIPAVWRSYSAKPG